MVHLLALGTGICQCKQCHEYSHSICIYLSIFFSLFPTSPRYLRHYSCNKLDKRRLEMVVCSLKLWPIKKGSRNVRNDNLITYLMNLGIQIEAEDG